MTRLVSHLFTERKWQKVFTEAPRDESIKVLMPTGETDHPDAQPIAWAYLPDIDDDIADEYGLTKTNDGEVAA